MYHRAATTVVLSLLLGAALTKSWIYDAAAFKNPHFVDGHDVIVNLFEWKWPDIAEECENFLGPKGYGGVETSPVTENLIIESRPWFERYEPISYKWTTRSGNERQFRDMVRRCNDVGVRVYVLLVLNHMTENRTEALGTGNSTADPVSRNYPAVPYNTRNFNQPCDIVSWEDVEQIRNCRVYAHDLNQTNPYVLWKIVRLMDDLMDAGVAGFRIDMATFMWPDDLKTIYARVKPLNADHGFANGSRPYIYQSTTAANLASISKYEYNSLAAVIEPYYPSVVHGALYTKSRLHIFVESGREQFLLPTNDAVIFVDDPETQRFAMSAIITHKSPKLYKMANAFMLAHTYGTPIVMSSYAFDNVTQGPPADEYENIVSPMTKDDDSCEGGWICEHRWRQISNMIAFRNTVRGASVNDWWFGNNSNQMAFSRDDRGFVAINAAESNLNASIQTKLPRGHYCDVISGDFVDGECSGKVVHVNKEGFARLLIGSNDTNGVIAIHRNAKLSNDAGLVG